MPIKSALVKVGRYIWSSDLHHSFGLLAWPFRCLSLRPWAISKQRGTLAALEKWNTVRGQGRAEEYVISPLRTLCLSFPHALRPASSSHSPSLPCTLLKEPEGSRGFSLQASSVGRGLSPPGTMCTNAKPQIPPGGSLQLNMEIQGKQIYKERRDLKHFWILYNFSSYFLLTWMHAQCQALCHPVDCNPQDSSVHGDSPGKNTGGGYHFRLQGIFPTQGLNLHFLHWQPILYHCVTCEATFYLQLLQNIGHDRLAVQCILEPISHPVDCAFLSPAPLSHSSSPHWYAIVCSLYLCLLPFLIFTSLLYFLDFTRRWYHMVFVFLWLILPSIMPSSPYMLLQMVKFCSVWCLSSISLYMYTTSSLSIRLLMDT